MKKTSQVSRLRGPHFNQTYINALYSSFPSFSHFVIDTFNQLWHFMLYNSGVIMLLISNQPHAMHSAYLKSLTPLLIHHSRIIKKYRLINSQFRFKYQFSKFWCILTIMNIQISMSRNFPTIPKLHHGSLYTPDSHGEGIDVFIQLIQQTNGLDDHVVYTMNIKLYFCSRVTVAQTQLCLGSHWTSQSLDHLLKMKSYSSEDL